MRIDEYLSRYENYRITYNALLNTLKKYTENESGENSLLTGVRRNEIYKLKREVEHRKRILTHASVRLEAAVSRMENRSQANYIICKYFYGMRNIDFAITFTYCERHVYRLALAAKQSLYKELLKLMPKPRRGETGKVYRYSRSIKKQAV